MPGDLLNRAQARRHNLLEQVSTAQADVELIDAWIGLDSVLRGAWGTENVEALGGGAEKIREAHTVLGRDVEKLLGGTG